MSTITFVQLSPDLPADAPANADGTLRLTGFAAALTLELLGAIADGTLVLEQTSDALPPEAPGVITGDGTIVLMAEGASLFAGEPAEADGILLLTGLANWSTSVGDGTLRLTGRASTAYTPDQSLYPVVSMGDALVLSGAGLSVLTLLLSARLQLHAAPHTTWAGTATLNSSLALEDGLVLVYRQLMQVSLSLGDATTVSSTAIAQMVDALLLGGAVATELEAVQLIVEALTFGALAEASNIATLVAGLTLGEAVASTYKAMVALVDGLLLTEALAGQVTLVAAIRDGLVAGAAGATTLEAHAVLRDGLDFVLRLAIDSHEYVAWAINTESKGLSRYTQYPFNSFMQVGGKYYGATDTGIYRLEGDDDAGVPIDAKLRLGMSSLGTRVMKRAPAMYAGYSASGDLLLKVITAHPETGEREAHAYRLVATAAGSVREGRIPIGRGLKSVYWDFQLENLNGADFELDVIELQPLMLERRVRGNSGGKR